MSKDKKAKNLWKVLFGRTTIIVILVLMQIALILGTYAFFESKMIYANGVITALSFIVAIYIINVREDSSFKLTWIFAIMIAPVFGTLFYLFVKVQPETKAIEKKLEYILNRQRPLQEQNWEVYEKVAHESEAEAGFARYMDTRAWAPVYDNCSAKYFPIGEDYFEELIIQLKQARYFIFMEFFILDYGYMWDEILEILKEKVKEGVEVRFLYDGTCSLTLLPYDYYKEIEQYGIRCKPFAQIKPFLSTHQNNRDHRKIVVIDGVTAFTGGINIADEYINRKERFGHWKDTGIMIQGYAVSSMTLMFLQLWDVREKNLTDYSRYIVSKEEFRYFDLCGHEGGYIIPYGDSPMDDEPVGRQVYIDILNRAKRYVHIMTPYLILDNGMMTALAYAAKRGVEVTIIMPHIPDKAYAYLLARTYYKDLIEMGINIYEYVPGFVHAKVYSCDDERAVVGTINMDYRSLYLHFECGIYVKDNGVIDDIERDFAETLAKCRRMTVRDCKKYGLHKKVAGKLLRVVAPLM